MIELKNKPILTNEITIRALKYPNYRHYEWQGYILEKTDSYIAILCKPGRDLKHYTKQRTFTINNWAIEIFSFNEWFTVSCEIEDGKIVSYYCNVAKPSVLNEKDEMLTFVDLDLDVVKRKFRDEWQVVDEDEFEVNKLKYGYPTDLSESAVRELNSLLHRIENQLFPFDGTIYKYINEKIPS